MRSCIHPHMSVLDDVVGFLEHTDGVLQVIVMDEAFSELIRMEELSTKSATGMDVINCSYDEVMTRHNRLALIVDNLTFDSAKKDYTSVLMVNTRGDVVGRSLRDEEIDAYHSRDDVIWISRDFIMFPDAEFDGGEKFIIPATETSLLDPVLPHTEVIMAHPCTTSDMIIKESVGFDLRRKASTVVLGFDYRHNIDTSDGRNG